MWKGRAEWSGRVAHIRSVRESSPVPVVVGIAPRWAPHLSNCQRVAARM